MIANVGKYCLTVVGNEIAVTDATKDIDLEDYAQYDVPPMEVAGLAKFLAWKKGIAVVLTSNEDMDIINLIRKGTQYGEAYALNVTFPYFSEYGDCGIIR